MPKSSTLTRAERSPGHGPCSQVGTAAPTPSMLTSVLLHVYKHLLCCLLQSESKAKLAQTFSRDATAKRGMTCLAPCTLFSHRLSRSFVLGPGSAFPLSDSFPPSFLPAPFFVLMPSSLTPTFLMSSCHIVGVFFLTYSMSLVLHCVEVAGHTVYTLHQN